MIRPDDTVFQKDDTTNDVFRAWKHSHVPITWQHMMYEHMLYTAVMSATMFRDDEFYLAPNKVSYSKTATGASGQPVVDSRHHKTQGLIAGYLISWPRNALQLVTLNARAVRVWAGDMCKHATNPVDLETAINMVAHYIEQDIDRRPHFVFNSGCRVTKCAEAQVKSHHTKAPIEREKREMAYGPLIETLT